MPPITHDPGYRPSTDAYYSRGTHAHGLQPAPPPEHAVHRPVGLTSHILKDLREIGKEFEVRAPSHPALVPPRSPIQRTEYFEATTGQAARWTLPAPGDLDMHVGMCHEPTGKRRLIALYGASNANFDSAKESFVCSQPPESHVVWREMTFGCSEEKRQEPLMIHVPESLNANISYRGLSYGSFAFDALAKALLGPKAFDPFDPLQAEQAFSSLHSDPDALARLVSTKFSGDNLVEMDSLGRITVNPSSSQILATQGLGGCTVIVALASTPDRARKIWLGHQTPFFPDPALALGKELRQFKQQHGDNARFDVHLIADNCADVGSLVRELEAVIGRRPFVNRYEASSGAESLVLFAPANDHCSARYVGVSDGQLSTAP